MARDKLICDCGKEYTPSKKYQNDPRVKCSACIRITRSAEVKARCVAYLGGKCIDCGFDGPAVAFDFDHKDKSKKSYKISGNYIFRWSELKKELNKCELRCCRCHRIRHWMDENGNDLFD